MSTKGLINFKKLNIQTIFFAILLVCYLLLSSNNQSLDAWEYAQNVKQEVDLFKAHHLLYNWFMYSLKSFPLFEGLDTMKFMQFINGVFALISLYVLFRILFVLLADKSKAQIWTILVGSSFAVLRYATENETYIIPIFFLLRHLITF